MGDFDSLYASLSEDPRIRGRQFEEICKWFFQNDPVYAHELKTVWLWNDWPGRWGGDAGIDLVAEDRNGCLWAIQAKAYDPKYRVSKKDVDKFLAESGRRVFAYRMLIATTDLIDRTGERTIQQQEKRSSFFRLNDLRAASVDWPSTPAQLRPGKRRKPAKPRPHQQAAIRDVVKGFGTSDRGQLIMACGTGKTLTGLFITEKLKAQRTLVLLPSLSLLKQTLNEWRANCITDFASLPVCSDATVSDTEDAAITRTADLGFPVTTDAQQIATFLRRKSGPLVVFSTYQSSPQIEAAFKIGRVPGFDLILADEAHRVAGPVSSDFATVLDPKAIRGSRLLLMTATPRYYTGRVIKAAQEADYEIASMDDETKFGPVFHRLSFGDAIERDLLTDYQVAIVGVDDATYREWAEKGTLVTRDGKRIDNAATLAGQIGLAKAMRKYDLRRLISFHSRVKRAREFASSLPDVIDWMPARQRPKGRLWSDVATGEMPAGDRYRLLQHLGRLDDAERGLLANARCLSEGVDVPTLDGVAFIDPRRSEVDIVQAVGRAIRKSKAKTVGTIVIPVFIDTGEDPAVVLDSSVFKPVWDVIKALRAHDEELGAQLDELRRQLGRKGGRPRLPDKIHFDVPVTVGKDFAAAFDARLVEQTTAGWEFWYGLMDRYVEQNGDARVPQEYRTADGFPLGTWVGKQRRLFIVGTLIEDRLQRLDLLPGWSWNTLSDDWSDCYERTADYARQHGTSRVPRHFMADGIALGMWVTTQRFNHRKGLLNQERERQLEALPGWSWDPHTDAWERGFQRAVIYARANGDSRVPKEFIDAEGFPLGTWVAKQRKLFAAGQLDADRRQRLEELDGWAWETRSAAWDEGYRRLTDYIKEHGNAAVVSGYRTPDGFRLGGWIAEQRTAFSRGTMTPEREQLLQELPGWLWDARSAAWDEGYRRLSIYISENRHARVPAAYHTADGFALGRWVSSQRKSFAAGTLDDERQQRLRQLSDWTWETRSDAWDVRYRSLNDYVIQYGHADVPSDYITPEGFPLGRWVIRQRNELASGKLTADKQQRLESLDGWIWDTRSDSWEEGYQHLISHVDHHGDARVSDGYRTQDGFQLGRWVSYQRIAFGNSKLSLDRRRRLESVPGWVWDVLSDNWDRRYEEVATYARDHGTSAVPQSYRTPEGGTLGSWVSNQRTAFAKNKLHPERQRRLESLPGWVWRTR